MYWTYVACVRAADESELIEIDGADKYKGHEEAGFIYFFDRRVFPTGRGGRLKPVRATRDGVWKASGGGKALTTMKRGGVVVGYKLTLVFYQKKYAGDKHPDKTEWGMNEYTLINGPNNKVINHPLTLCSCLNAPADSRA